MSRVFLYNGTLARHLNPDTINPFPTISSIDPPDLDEGETGQDVTINGTNFLPSTTGTFDGNSRTVVYVSSTQVTMTLLTADLDTAGTFSVRVINPSPSGGTSSPHNFVVNTPVTYATWDSGTKGANVTLSGGDLTVSRTGSGDWQSVRSTVGKSSGKWYWEVTLGSGGGGENDFIHGAGDSSLSASSYVGSSSNSTGFQDATAFGQILKYRNAGFTATGGATWTTGDVIQLALDMDTGKIWWGKNGTFNGDPAAGTGEAFSSITGTQFAAASLFSGFSATANFGATAFAHSVPSGFNSGLYS